MINYKVNKGNLKLTKLLSHIEVLKHICWVLAVTLPLRMWGVQLCQKLKQHNKKCFIHLIKWTFENASTYNKAGTLW